MKIGILAWVAAHTADYASVARKCEAVGFESFFLAEHPIFPVDIKTQSPRGNQVPAVYAHMPDPFVALGVCAAVTNRMKLGTGICLVPERDPKILAKEVATVDLVSQGRFIFQIGAGWLIEESRIMGVSFRRRWDMTLEYVRAMKELWTKPEASFDGEFVKFPPIKSNPKPIQKPHPPVHIGAGNSPGPAVERALQVTTMIGDGWAPIALTPQQLAEALKRLRELCGHAGRDFNSMEITVYGPVGNDPKRALDEYREAGAHRLVLMNASLAPDKYEREIDDFARNWIA